MSKKQFLIIGPGKVGLTFAKLSESMGFDKVVIAVRSEKSLENAKQYCKSEVFQFCYVKDLSTDEILASDFICFTTQDKYISDVCSLLAFKLINSPKIESNIVAFHTSGHKSSEELHVLKKFGIHTASIHPIKSITDPENAFDTFKGSYCAIEGDDIAVKSLSDFIEQVKGIPIKVNTESKPLYHAAAVVACNYSIALYDTALKMYAKSGIDEETAMQIINSLVQGTINNFNKLGSPKSLTGPIERGDAEVVSEHLRVINEQTPSFEDLYRVLALRTAEIAKDKGLSEDLIQLLLSTIKK